MYDNWSYGLKMDVLLAIMFISLMFASAESVASVDDAKETSITAQNSASEPQSGEHTLAKRAWQQLQGGWGKRNSEDESKQDSLEELQRKVLQLLANRVEDAEYVPDYYDAPVEKRSWQSMGNAWGKRNWSQMRGSGWGKREAGNWNNMRGLWGKRSPGELKLKLKCVSGQH
jgi:hypothetical protein